MFPQILVNGVPVPPEQADASVSAVAVEPGVYSVLIDGASFEIRVDGNIFFVNGSPFRVEIRDPRALVRAASAGAHEGRQTLQAAMPGKVVRLPVSEGSEVASGQGIVVVEAMKMQNEVRSAGAGRVLSLRVQEGQAVAAGDTLAVIG